MYRMVLKHKLFTAQNALKETVGGIAIYQVKFVSSNFPLRHKSQDNAGNYNELLIYSNKNGKVD